MAIRISNDIVIDNDKNFFGTQFTSLSDASKKTNIRPIENSI